MDRLALHARRASAALLVALGALHFAACHYDWALPADGGTTEGGVVESGAQVDAQGGEGGGAFSCAGSLFCDTFDDGPLTPKWADTFAGAGSTLRIEPLATAPTLPNVLLAARDTSGGTPGTAYATKVVSVPLRRASLSFKIRPESFGSTARACVAGIVFNDGSGDEHLARILVGSDSAIVQEKVPTLIAHPLASTVDVGAWSRVTLSVEVGGHIVVTVNEVPKLDVPADSSWTMSTSTRIVLGINFSEDVASSFALHFDDVRLDGS